ncbi:MAG: diphosphatase [Pseudomonadota bacterium]|jgi:NAD+ diphosphatase
MIWLIFANDALLIGEQQAFPANPSEFGLLIEESHDIGDWRGIRCLTAEIQQPLPTLPTGWAFQPLRSLMPTLQTEMFQWASKAFQTLQWAKNHRFCGRCGAKTDTKLNERAKICSQCGFVQYPRLSPAVIMRIRKGKEILLSRSPHFKTGMYSVQAGFIEVGETLEEAVKREIFEETRLEIKNIRYFGSQSWPFPHSLMMAFTADYLKGELAVQKPELEDARWFRRTEKLPALPPRLSIARQLIEDFLKL